MKKTAVLLWIAVFCLYHHSFAQLSITSFSPLAARAGDTVKIVGSGFNYITSYYNTVYFGTARAAVVSATQTELKVVVPSAATYDPISVSLRYQSKIVYSQLPFNLLFSGATGFAAYSFAAKKEYGNGIAPGALCAADFDGFYTDIANLNYAAGTISVLKNIIGTDTAYFEAVPNLTAGTNPVFIKAADIDADEKIDFATVNAGANTFSFFKSASTSVGSVAFANKVDFVTGPNPRSLAIADIDGDWFTDIVVADFDSDSISIFKGNSGLYVGIAPRTDIATFNGPVSVVLGDINDDRKPDLIVLNNLHNSISVFKNTSSSGAISFDAPVTFTGGNNAELVLLGDFDRDGKLDIASSNINDNTVSIFRNHSISGSVSFDARQDFVAGNQPAQFAIGDLDGDGLPEIVSANRAGNNFSVLKNTSAAGNISFAGKVDYSTGTSSPNHIAIADMTGDGKPDIVASIDDATTMAIFRNKTNEPTIFSFSPTYAAWGDTVTIVGNKLNGTTAVTFGGHAAMSFTIVSPDTIRARVASGASGFVKVKTNTGSDSLGGFVHAPNPPVLNANFNIMPSPVYPGTTVQFTDVSSISTGSIVSWHWDFGNAVTSSIQNPTTVYTHPGIYLIYLTIKGDAGDSATRVYTIYVQPFSVVNLCPSVDSTQLSPVITGNSFQWEMSIDSINFINIYDNINFIGTNTSQLYLKNIPSSWYGRQFRCATDISSYYSTPFVIKFTNQFLNTSGGNWEDPSNWSCGSVPDAETDVTINGMAVLNSNASCRSIHINPGATFAVSSGFTLTITH